MKKVHHAALIALLALSACGKGDDDSVPTGQVVATIGGQEVTIAELNAEIAKAGETPTAAERDYALQTIITRKLLAAEAEQRDLTSKPETAILLNRARETALAQILAKEVAASIPEISDNEVQEFLRTYPASVTQRRILSTEEVIVPNMPKAVFDQLVSLKSLDEAIALLNRNKVVHRMTANMIDTITLEPGMAQKIADTQGNDIYIIPLGSAYRIGRIVSSKVDPIPPETANEVARNLLTRERATNLVNTTLGQIVENGRRKVRINAEFAPKTPVSPTPQDAVAGTGGGQPAVGQ